MVDTVDLEVLVSSLSDDDLSDLDVWVRDELHARALAREDTDALIVEAFDTMFDRRGLPEAPKLTAGGVLVCAGAVVARSPMSHRCGFVHVDGAWVWEAQDRIDDVVRGGGDRGGSMRSITLVLAREGTRLDLVLCKTAGGVHRRERVRSFSVKGGALIEEAARDDAPVPGGSR